MGAVVGNVFYNTESGLTPPLDRLTGMLDQDAKERQQFAGLAPALLATGIPVPQQQGGILSRIFNGLGLGNDAAPSQAAQPAPQPQPASSAPTPRADTLPSFAAAGGVSPNVQQALAYFQDKGLSPIAAQGLVGNFMRESGGNLDPNAVNPTGGATGIAQWLGPRAQGLQQFAKAAGRPLNDLRTQLDYAWSELSGPEKATLAALQKATNPLQAAVAGIGYERSEGWSASNPIGAKDFSKRLAATAGLAGMPAEALAFSPQAGGTADAPASQAISGALPPGFTQAGADVAAAGLRGRAAAGYPAPPTGVGTGAQTAGAAGGQPMPIASASAHVTPTMQPGSAPGVARAPLGGITNEALGAMIANPASRDLGLKLWQQKLGKGDFGFSITPDGTVIRTDKETGTATPVYQAPVKQGFTELNGRLMATDPLSGTARDATPAGLPSGYRFATPQERQGYGVQDGQPLFIGPDGKPGTLNGGTNVTLNNAIDPIQKAAGERFDRSLTAAEAAAKTIPAIRTARQQLDAGIFSGALAGEKLGLQKLAESLGLPGVDPSRITNTETFRAAVGPIVLQTVRGLGAGAGISNADRDFAERMAGGNIALDGSSIRRMLDIQEKAANATIQQHQLLVDQLRQTPAGAAAYKNTGSLMSVTAPPDPANTRTIGGQTYTKGPDGRWYVGQ